MKNENNSINRFYFVCGLVICLCAIAEFIIWIVDASKIHLPNQVIMGTGFLSVTVGVLWYLLARGKSRSVADWGLWTGIIASIVLFFIGVAVTPSTEELGAIYPQLL